MNLFNDHHDPAEHFLQATHKKFYIPENLRPVFDDALFFMSLADWSLV